MNESNAAGRKTENPAHAPRGYVRHIEAILGMMPSGVSDALKRAGEIPLTYDDYGHKRHSEVDIAVKLATLGTQLAQTLEKLEDVRGI
jgi:hypothetical protein